MIGSKKTLIVQDSYFEFYGLEVTIFSVALAIYFSASLYLAGALSAVDECKHKANSIIEKLIKDVVYVTYIKDHRKVGAASYQ